MSNIFVAKLNQKNLNQIDHAFIVGGPEGSPWYGDVKIGDYVFPALSGKIIGLWRAKAFSQDDSDLHKDDDGYLQFDIIKKYANISLTNHFTRYKYFIHDLNLVNKAIKSVKGLGFIPIKTRVGCPVPEDIDFESGVCSIYIAYEDARVNYKAGDIRVLLTDPERKVISRIERFEDDSFNQYSELQKLYDDRNRSDGYHTIHELLNYSIEDNASKKHKFLSELIDHLDENKYFKVSDMVRLYDNVLVGRKRSTLTLPITPTTQRVEIENETDDDEFMSGEIYEDIASLLKYNPNLILYGPPGTGKTYATSKIIDAYEKKNVADNGSYKTAHAENRIRQITFHQSYSYEDFIEGIRPGLHEEAGTVTYTLENGVFKEFCLNSEKEMLKSNNQDTYVDRFDSTSVIWKLSLGKRNQTDIYQEAVEKNEIAINMSMLGVMDLSDLGYDDILDELEKVKKDNASPTQHAHTIYSFTNEMKTGDIVLIYDGPDSIRQIGIVASDYIFREQPSFAHRRKVEWIPGLKLPIQNIKSFNGGKALTMKTLYRLSNMTVSDITRMISIHSTKERTSVARQYIKPYYMIIDEINRGNIARIFGELITLIEQDKRGVETLLPYSKKPFKIPSNLILIGTMNTADRSLAAIDTALRRRFTFVEIEPDSSVISQDNSIINDNVDLSKLLDAINLTITEIFDRDHRIGHAYFMGIDTLNSLYQTWYYKIIPLLNEYFYNDVESVQKVIGKAFVDNNGKINFLDMNAAASSISDFEDKLQKIYKNHE